MNYEKKDSNKVSIKNHTRSSNAVPYCNNKSQHSKTTPARRAFSAPVIGSPANISSEANRLDLQCGRDYLLASIDNDPTESVFAGIGITSSELPMYACGKKAAKLPTGKTFKRLSQRNAPSVSARPNSSFGILHWHPARPHCSSRRQLHSGTFSRRQTRCSRALRAVNTSRRVLELSPAKPAPKPLSINHPNKTKPRPTIPPPERPPHNGSRPSLRIPRTPSFFRMVQSPYRAIPP